ncbi:MAG: type IV pilus modification PilV family protein [Solirubrobacterales bacterium]
MRHARREDGFTMVETLVAIMMLVLGVVATLSLLDASRRTNFRAEQSQAINNVAQRELEEIRSLEYDQIALIGAPAHNADTNHPGNRVSTNGGTFDLNAAAGSTENATLVVSGGTLEGGGQVAGAQVAATEPFDTGDISGDIFRYVVWRDDPKCLLGSCIGGVQDFKRLIVAVKVDETAVAGYGRTYQEFQTDVIDPDASTLTSDPTGGNLPTTAQQFWLSDQRCVAGLGDPTPYTAPLGDATNNTTGTCAGTNMPDALRSEAPECANACAPPPDTVDYATDLEPPDPPNDDKGLQLLRQSSNGCSSSVTDPQRIHWWSTKQLVTTGGFAMSGASTLELWTRSIHDVRVQGSVCIYLRYQPITVGVDLLGVPIYLESPRSALPLTSISSPTAGFSCSRVDLGLNGVGTCTTTIWPYGSWQKLRINLLTSPTTIATNSRLEIGISVERANTPQDALQFLYDHPTYDSRWEVITTSAL